MTNMFKSFHKYLWKIWKNKSFYLSLSNLSVKYLKCFLIKYSIKLNTCHTSSVKVLKVLFWRSFTAMHLKLKKASLRKKTTLIWVETAERLLSIAVVVLDNEVEFYSNPHVSYCCQVLY